MTKNTQTIIIKRPEPPKLPTALQTLMSDAFQKLTGRHRNFRHPDSPLAGYKEVLHDAALANKPHEDKVGVITYTTTVDVIADRVARRRGLTNSRESQDDQSISKLIVIKNGLTK